MLSLDESRSPLHLIQERLARYSGIVAGLSSYSWAAVSPNSLILPQPKETTGRFTLDFGPGQEHERLGLY
jgi:hypothetical protein